MFDPNERKKKRLVVYISVLLVVMPFIFIYLKYYNKQPPTKVIEVTKIEQLEQFDGSDRLIFVKDIAHNMVKIPFEVRSMMLSHDKKRLYTTGHDRDGISIIDISDINKIKILGLFYFPKARYHVQNVGIQETKDGKSLYISSQSLGILRLDITDMKNIKIAASFKMKNALDIKISDDDKTAFVKTIDGLVALDISSDNIREIGKFNSLTKQYPVLDLNSGILIGTYEGGLLWHSKNYLFMRDLSVVYLLDVSNPKNITQISVFSSESREPGLQISPDKKRFYAGTGIYDITDLKNVKFLGKYVMTTGFFEGIEVTKNRSLAYIGRGKEGGDDISHAGIDVVDITSEIDPVRIKTYGMPEADYVKAILSPDERYIIIAPVVKFQGHISVYKRR